MERGYSDQIPMLFSELKSITDGQLLQLSQDGPVTTLLTDSRKATASDGAVFFAINGLHHDGHRFIPQLYRAGVRQFVVEHPTEIGSEANALLVKSSVTALQQIVAFHRSGIQIPVVGITGSNGKTIVKEWLYQLLSPDFKIAKNPASYNSQIGVPLSVWQLQPHHTLGIFEAGISTVNEMGNLQRVLRPTVGIFTNIGPAHDEGFSDVDEKIREKLKLFAETPVVVYCKDHDIIDRAFQYAGLNGFTWGTQSGATLRVVRQNEIFHITGRQEEFMLRLPFSDQASIENCLHCVAVLIHFGVAPKEIQRRVSTLRAVPMRLELKEGINHCQIIDDTYNNDLAGLQVSLDFLAHQHQRPGKRLILSDIHESGLSDQELVKNVSLLLSQAHIDNFIGIGPTLFAHQNDIAPKGVFFESTEDCLRNYNFNNLHDEVILVKGARVFAFEKIVNHIEQKVHGTVMEIDLGALVHNLNYFRSRLRTSTKIMAMVKAFAYGSGSNEIANVLQYHKIDYLGVAYADEGIELRKNNISLPIMVMNPQEESFEALLNHELEPEVYSLSILRRLSDYLQARPCRIHIKIDTGMHRLGFAENEIDDLINLLSERRSMMVTSIFSHLAGADEEAHDNFSEEQGNQFQRVADRISQRLGYRPMYHLLNSSGIIRFPSFQFDMVRLGIGLYGINPTRRRYR